MSGTVWGTPLIGSAAAADPASDTSLIADLNNWTKEGFSNPVEINYDPATRTNTFSYPMEPNVFERMCYKFKVEPETHYIFALKLGGNFTEENKDSAGETHHFNILVTRDIISQDVFTDVLKPSSSEENGIVINSYCYAYTSMDFTKKRDFALPFFTYKQQYADSDPRNDEETIEGEPAEHEQSDTDDDGYVYLYIDFSAITDYTKSHEVYDIILKDVRCVTWDPGLFYLTGPIIASNEPGGVWHIIASYPGAWIWPFVDNVNHVQHIFALSGDPFKLIDVATDYDTGYLSTSYRSSEPVVIDGRTYHKAHMKIIDIEGSDIIAHLAEKEYTDDVIYTKLSEYVRKKEPYNFIEVLDDTRLHTWLGGYNFASMFGLTEEEFASITGLEKI